MPSPLEESLRELRRLLEGHTDRREEDRVLAILSEANGEDLNQILQDLDLNHLIDAVDNRWFGPDNRDKLVDLLTVKRLGALNMASRIGLADAFQKGLTQKPDEKALRNLFVGTQGRDLTVLKNGIDAGGDYRDLQQLVFHDIDDDKIQREILAHIESEGAAVRPQQPPLKVISDIDDTVYASLKDDRYPRRTTYPGVVQFYEELDRGHEASPDRQGDLVFLTARPRIRTGDIEDLTHRTLRERGMPEATILSGEFLNLIGDERIAKKKYENFVEYQQLFPEYDFLFVGDSGQGDAIFGARIVQDFPERVRAVFIHDVVQTDLHLRNEWKSKGVRFFDTYVGAAGMAIQDGLIGTEGLERIIQSAIRELEEIPFPGDEQRGQRTEELERDIRTARG